MSNLHQAQYVCWKQLLVLWELLILHTGTTATHMSRWKVKIRHIHAGLTWKSQHLNDSLSLHICHILRQSEQMYVLETVESYRCYKRSRLEVNCVGSHFVLRVISVILFLCWSFSWGRAGQVLRWKRQRRRTHNSHVGLFCVCNGSREPFSPPAPHISTGSNAAHKMPVTILWKAFCFNKERHNRDYVWPVCLKNTEIHNEKGFLRQHRLEH